MAVAVSLVPIGRPDPETLDALAQDLRDTGFDAEPVQGEDLPGSAFDPRRGQYRADVLLDMLPARAGERVLGIADADLYVEGLNFVLGWPEGRPRWSRSPACAPTRPWGARGR